MWSIVEFDDGIQLVPMDWLDKTKGLCKWPPYTNQKKIDNSIKELEQPEPTWGIHKILRIFGNADSYEVGLKRLKKAELTSDLETENENEEKKKRRERARRSLSSDCDSDGEGVLKKPKSSEGLFPKIALPKLNLNVSIPSRLATPLTTTPPSTFSCSSTTTPNVTPKLTPSKFIARKCSASDTIDVTPIKDTPSSSISKKLSPYKHRKTVESDHYRNIMYKLNTVLFEVRRLDSRLTEMSNQKTQAEVEKEELVDITCDYELPLNNLEELENLESKLKSDKVFFNKLLMRLKMVASADVHITVYNIMKTLLSNGVAVKFSFAGAKTKQSFKILMLYKVLVAAVRLRHPDALDATISENVGKWLVQATLRLSRQMKKSETSGSCSAASE